MKCPNCGFEMQEGHLICENCGFEIKIVPEFVPDPVLPIDSTLVTGAEEDETDRDGETGTEEDGTEEDSFGLDVNIKAVKHSLLILIIIIAATLLIVIGAVCISVHTNSVDYQINRAEKSAAEGEYESAIDTLENLYVSHPDESRIFFLEAEYYQEMGKKDLAEDTLSRMILSDGFDEKDISQAYDRLISLYDENGEYQAIDTLLDECTLDDVKLAYQNYMAMTPVFSLEPGDYDSAVRLKISANTSGVIYYTLDGSVPNELSSCYDSPILLDHGSYEVTAVFVNKYGIRSDMLSGTFNIASDIPESPVVNADSDDYTEPVLITCEVPEGTTVYYTTDKSEPTVDSTKYTDPIPMPVGYSNFSFIAVNDQGLVSDIVVRSYYLSFPDGLSYDEAVTRLKERLVERGVLNDLKGNSDRAPGLYTYQVISAIPIEGQGDYYTIREFYHDDSGDVTPTDTTYIVEIHQGSTAILGGDAVNGFLAISF